MSSTQGEVKMRYEGDRSQHDKLECVFTYRGKEYRLMYFWITSLAALYDLPEPVREEILFWAKMLNNPD
jgi:hypothetical protein